jgi:signal transduction histidine kinase
VQYVHAVRHHWSLARRYGLDALIVLLAIAALLEVVLRRDSADAPRMALWLAMPAIAIVVVPLFAWRRFPFGAPAAYWLVAVGVSFVDGRLIPFLTSVFAIGMTASFLLGNIRDAWRARIGLAIVLGSAAVIVYNLPGHPASQLVFIPLLFGISWLAGFALRERAAEADAAEGRAGQAERELDAAARVAVAEERARIARELHDIVAHSVSVMVLQVGAVRHGLPDALVQDRDALRGVDRSVAPH